MEKTRICPVCGGEVTNRNRKYCCEACSKKGYLKNQIRRNKERDKRLKEEKEKRAGRRRPESPLEELARKAREAGMTYGQYVGMEYLKSVQRFRNN